jgi:hypothetical protein
MTFRRIILALFFAGMVTLAAATPAAATAGETYGSLDGNWTWYVQDWLKHAAMKNPKWHSQREAVERHIENIGFLLQNASLAIRTADYAVAGINVRHAIKTLELGVDRGFYHRIDVEPLKLIISQQIPTQPGLTQDRLAERR